MRHGRLAWAKGQPGWRAAVRGFAGGALPAADNSAVSSRHKWIGRAVFAVRGPLALASACVDAD